MADDPSQPVWYRLIGPAGEDLGVMLATTALDLAEEGGLDLIAVDEESDPPTYRVGDYGHWKYELERRRRT